MGGNETMTKRYTVNQSPLGGYFVYDEETDFQFPAISEMEANIFCEKLNEQDQQIKQLKKENEILKHWNKCLAEKRHEELKYYTHQDCIHYCEKLHDEYECGEGHWWWETSCDNDGDIEEVGVCENFEKK